MIGKVKLRETSRVLALLSELETITLEEIDIEVLSLAAQIDATRRRRRMLLLLRDTVQFTEAMDAEAVPPAAPAPLTESDPTEDVDDIEWPVKDDESRIDDDQDEDVGTDIDVDTNDEPQDEAQDDELDDDDDDDDDDYSYYAKPSSNGNARTLTPPPASVREEPPAAPAPVAAPVKWPVISPVPGIDIPLKSRLQTYLSVSGPSKVQVIAEQLGVNYQTVYSSLSKNTDLFKQTGAGEFGLVRRG